MNVDLSNIIYGSQPINRKQRRYKEKFTEKKPKFRIIRKSDPQTMKYIEYLNTLKDKDPLLELGNHDAE